MPSLPLVSKPIRSKLRSWLIVTSLLWAPLLNGPLVSSVFYVGPMLFLSLMDSLPPHMMKKLVGAYFSVVENSLASTYMLTPRQVVTLSSIQESHDRIFC